MNDENDHQAPNRITIDLLNDDCLYAIFVNLKRFDLCAIHHTCKRFQVITDRIFKRHFLDVNTMDIDGDPARAIILFTCGPYINDLKILQRDNWIFGKKINFNSIAHLCKNLTHLTLKYCTIHLERTWPESLELFSELRFLYLDRCRFVGTFTGRLINFNNLYHLQMRGSETFRMYESTFPKFQKHDVYLNKIKICLLK